MPKNPHIGSSFEDFLKEDGTLEEVNTGAQKRLLAHQLDAARKRRRITKTALAKRIRTSRSQLDRVLDPDNANQTLSELARVATALGKRLHIELRDA
jgi:DNA-binding phage protein